MSKHYNVIFLSEDEELLDKTEKQVAGDVGYTRAHFPAEAESKALLMNADLIAIDSRVAGDRGHEVCEEFRKQKSTHHIAILLLAHTKGVDEKIKALTIGCDQSIYYPDSDDCVLEKMEQAIVHREKQESHAITDRGNGDDIEAFDYDQFYDACFDCESAEDLGKLFMSGANQLKLECAIQIRMKDDVVDVEVTGAICELDSLLLGHLRPATETMPLGTSLVVNRPTVGAIVKHMPISDLAHYDFIQETLEAMLDTINTQVENLSFEEEDNSTVNPAKILMSIAGEIYTYLSDIQHSGCSDTETVTNESTDTLLGTIGSILTAAKLLPEDEASLLGAVKNYIKGSIGNLRKGTAYGDNELGNLMNMLRPLIMPEHEKET